MGHKVNPISFRLGIIRNWDARWYADKDYAKLLQEDLQIRKHIQTKLADAGIPKVEIERFANNVTVTIHTAKPGIVIGRAGAKVEDLRKHLEALTSKRVRVNIQEVRVPELDAFLVSRNVADQISNRGAHRRAIKQAATRAMQRGAKGVKVVIAGRLGGAEMSRREREVQGKVPLHTLRADIDYAQSDALTTYGLIGIKVWIYKGEVLPPPKKRQPVATTVEVAEAQTPPGTEA